MIMADLLTKVRSYIEDHGIIEKGDRVVLGLSGGPDSLCLFDILLKLKDEIDFGLDVVHVNHKFRPIEAELDQEFVEKLCEEKGIKCHSFVRDCNEIAKNTGRSPEEAGRLVRYESFCKVAMAIELEGVLGNIKICVAQNRNDQAETILFRLIRGTGTDGLAGMEPLAPGTGGYLMARPLLETDRSEIEEYCMQEGLEPRIDKTNKETTYTRNKIRLELIPFINEKFGGDITQAMVRLGRNASEDRNYLSREAGRLYGRALIEREKNRIRLDRRMLADAHPSISRRAVSKAFRTAGLDHDIERVHLVNAGRLIASDASSGSVDFPGSYRLAVSYDEVLVIRDEKNQKAGAKEEKKIPEITKQIVSAYDFEYPDGMGQFAVFDADVLEDNLIRGKGYFDTLEVRTRQEGDFINLNAGRKSIQDLFVDMKVPKEERDDVWLIASGSEVLWIPEGVCRARYAEKYSLRQSSARALVLEMSYQL